MKELLYLCLKKDFISFVHKSFITLHPEQKYLHNWHIEAINYQLEQLMSNNYNRLLINIPPRNFKSLLVSVIWVAWLLAGNPKLKIIVISYSQRLSDKHHYDTMMIMNSEWYKEVFKVNIVKNNRFKLLTAQNGFRFSTSIGASLTGEGGDVIIVDDPHNPVTVYSKKHRDFVVNWYKNTLLSRFNNYSKGKLIIVMQRLHIEDLSGYLLSNDTYQSLIISVISNKNVYYQLNASYKKRYLVEEILDNNRYTKDSISKLQNVLGKYCFAAQYMQQPYKLEGIILIEVLNFYSLDDLLRLNNSNVNNSVDEMQDINNAEMIIGYDEHKRNTTHNDGKSAKNSSEESHMKNDEEKFKKNSRKCNKKNKNIGIEVKQYNGDIIHSWDTAATVGDNSDYSVCTVWLVKDDKYYLLDCIRQRLNYMQLQKKAKDILKVFPPVVVLIENKSSGIALVQYLSEEYNVISVNSKLSKYGRVESCLNMFCRVYLPDNHVLLNIILEELSIFPDGKYDDIVDSFSQFLIYMQSRKNCPDISVI